MKIVKDFRVFGIVSLLFLSIIFILTPILIKKSGVTVITASTESACQEIFLPGSIVTKINQENIKDAADFYSAIDGLEGRLNIMINGGPRVCEINLGEKIDVKVISPEKKGIKFGVDIRGGKEFIIETENASKSLLVLEKRLNNYELKDTKIKKLSEDSFIVAFDSANEYKIEKLFEPGIISAKFMKNIEIKNSTGKLLLNDSTYNIEVKNNTLKIDGNNHKIGDEFLLNGINAKIYNVTENYTSFFLDVFDSDGVEKVLTDNQNSRVFQNQGEYVYVLNIILSKEVGKEFSKVTANQPSVINPQGEDYLQDPLIIFIDDKIITSIPILKSDSGREVTQFVIWGVENKKEQADEKFLILSSYLKSGKLPDIKIIERKDVEPENKGLLDLTIYFITGVIILSCVYGFVRFKKIGIVGLTLAVLIIECLLFLGVVSSHIFAFTLVVFCCISAFINNQVNKWIKWITIGLMLLISFAAAVNKMVVDRYTLFGIMIGFSISMLQFIFLNEGLIKAKHEKFNNYIWKASFVLTAILTFVFFLQDYRNISVTATIILMTSITLTKPEYIQTASK